MNPLIRSRSSGTKLSYTRQTPGQSPLVSRQDASPRELNSQDSGGSPTPPQPSEPATQGSDASAKLPAAEVSRKVTKSKRTMTWLGKTFSEHWGKTVLGTAGFVVTTIGLVLTSRNNAATEKSDKWRNKITFRDECVKDAERHAQLTPDCERAMQEGPPLYPRWVDTAEDQGEITTTRNLVAWLEFNINEMSRGFTENLIGYPPTTWLNNIALPMFVLLYWYCIDSQEKHWRHQRHDHLQPPPDAKLTVRMSYAALRSLRYTVKRMIFDLCQDLRDLAVFLAGVFGLIIVVYCPPLIAVLNHFQRGEEDARDVGFAIGAV